MNDQKLCTMSALENSQKYGPLVYSYFRYLFHIQNSLMPHFLTRPSSLFIVHTV